MLIIYIINLFYIIHKRSSTLVIHLVLPCFSFSSLSTPQPCIGMNLPELVEPVLACFNDQDPRVRYYACESLYNISKVARGSVLVFFNAMFDGLCKVSHAPYCCHGYHIACSCIAILILMFVMGQSFWID